MSKKKIHIILIAAFFAVAVYFIYDTVVAYSEISRNREILKSLEKDSKQIEEEILETRLKIEKFHKDPKAAEILLRNKFEMLRKDQYYINDKNN